MKPKQNCHQYVDVIFRCVVMTDTFVLGLTFNSYLWILVQLTMSQHCFWQWVDEIWTNDDIVCWHQQATKRWLAQSSARDKVTQEFSLSGNGKCQLNTTSMSTAYVKLTESYAVLYFLMRFFEEKKLYFQMQFLDLFFFILQGSSYEFSLQWDICSGITLTTDDKPLPEPMFSTMSDAIWWP